MKTSTATVSIAGDFVEKLRAIAAAGFDGIEIFEQDFIASDLTPREVGAMVRDHGLEILLFQPFRDFEGLPEPHRARAFARAERKFDLMQELGTDLILVCSTVHPAALGGIDRAAADFHELGERAARRGLRVGFEALCWGRYVNDHRDAWEIVRRADHPHVGLILDSFHSLAAKIPVDTVRRIPGDKIYFLQLADAPAIEMDLLYWSRHFRSMPGEGDLDVTGFTRAVMATGYAGPWSLEIFNDQFRSNLPRLVAADGHRSLVHLMDRVKTAEPAVAASIPAIAAPSPVKAVEYIEFATRAAEAEPLEAMLASLGFVQAGRHVSKAVTLWRQGAVNVLVNTETTGFAHSAFLAHGTTVSEIALRVGDAQATMARAVALGTEPFAQATAPSELQIPGVRGVGGSVIRFVDDASELGRLWEVDFRMAPAGPFVGAGLTRIDHIGQTMAFGQMLSWALFYHAIFEASKAPMVDVADPDGLVRSQAVATPGGALRITLNGAGADRTQAGRFIADSFGSAVQHIAFVTDDIFATADALASRGCEVLEIGPNYYDDLEARFALDTDLLARMKSRRIMYDRDGDAEFFQLYSRTLGEGLFFEIVERRGGYAGYGAANAPFRTAAQRRLSRPHGMPKR
jgi:4-hydroxyphenylpyruvate dioxygenase